MGSVPAHLASGDGWTGFLPLDIVHEMFTVAAGDFSPGLLFDVRCACTIWMGSCRVQDWTQVSVAPKTFAPSADAVYKIKVTKNGERNTLFALGGDGVNGPVHWRGELPAPAWEEPGSAMRNEVRKSHLRAKEGDVQKSTCRVSKCAGCEKRTLAGLAPRKAYISGGANNECYSRGK